MLAESRPAHNINGVVSSHFAFNNSQAATLLDAAETAARQARVERRSADQLLVRRGEARNKNDVRRGPREVGERSVFREEPLRRLGGGRRCGTEPVRHTFAVRR